MKRQIITAAVLLCCAVLAAIVVALREDTAVVQIPDVTTRWNHTVNDRLHTYLSGELAVSVTGMIDGDAVLRTSYGDIQLSSGRVDKIVIGAEYWGSMCELKYEPFNVRCGNLTVRVALGTYPDCGDPGTGCLLK